MGCLLLWLQTQATQKATPPLLTAIHHRGQRNPTQQQIITQSTEDSRQHRLFGTSRLMQESLNQDKPVNSKKGHHEVSTMAQFSTFQYKHTAQLQLNGNCIKSYAENVSAQKE